METEFCFICAVKLGRGNRSEIGRQEKMDKLVSVSHTVEHSSTIISDILSRILNETVMREEGVCRICFNMLNDIDYHLKEAQEKTDEITAKFLDKEKDKRGGKQAQDPPRQVTKAAKRSKVVTNSGARPGTNSSALVSKTIQTEREPDEASFRSRSPSHVPVRGGGKGQSFFKSADQGIVYNTAVEHSAQLVRVKGERSKHRPLVDQGVDRHHFERRMNSSPDVSSVSPGLAEKKRKLLSRVLGSGRKKKVESEESEEEEENRLTIDMEERGREEKKERKRRDKKRRRKERSLRKERERRERRQANMTMSQVVTKKEQEDDRLSPDSDLDYSPPTSPGPGPEQTQTHPIPSPRKAADIRTVDLAQLGDLFSVSSAPSDAMTMIPQHQMVTHTITLPHPPQTSGNIITVHPTPIISQNHQESHKVFAKKSFPVQVAQQGRSQVVPLTQVDVPPPGTPIYLLPEGVTAVNVQQAEIQQIQQPNEIPIIDCQPLLNPNVASQGVSVTELTEVEDSDDDYLPPEEQKQEVVMKTLVPKQETTRKTAPPQIAPPAPAAKKDESSSPEKKNPGTPSIPCPQVMMDTNMDIWI